MGLLALQGAQALGGFLQRRKARKSLEDMKPLDYSQSDAYQTAESSANLAGRYAQQGLPEQSMRFQEDMINRSAAAGLASAGSLRQGIAGIGGLATGITDQYRKLASMDADQRIANRGQYFSQLQNLQGQQFQDFDYQMGYDMLKRSQRLGEMTAGQNQMNQGIQGMSDTLQTLASMGMGIPGGGGGGGIPGGSGMPSGGGTFPTDAGVLATGGLYG